MNTYQQGLFADQQQTNDLSDDYCDIKRKNSKVLILLIGIIILIIIVKLKMQKCSQPDGGEMTTEHFYNRTRKRRSREQFNQQKGGDILSGGAGKKIQYLRDVYDYQIVPTLQEFLEDFQINQEIRQRFRLSQQPVQCQREQKDIIVFISNILERLDSKNISENYQPPVGETSYTMDKQNMYICIQDQNGQIHSDDILLFVFVHEIAHVGNRTKGHDELFWSNFRLLLDILCNYEPKKINDQFPKIKYCQIDLGKSPFQNYCNKQEISYNPLFDKTSFLVY